MPWNGLILYPRRTSKCQRAHGFIINSESAQHKRNKGWFKVTDEITRAFPSNSRQPDTRLIVLQIYRLFYFNEDLTPNSANIKYLCITSKIHTVAICIGHKRLDMPSAKIVSRHQMISYFHNTSIHIHMPCAKTVSRLLIQNTKW